MPRRYLREVAAWQGVGWLCRFGAFWFFLEAFGIGGSFANVLLVMSVQAISTIIPFTPGGAGAQQALLVATLSGPSRAAVLSFSVGTADRDGRLVGAARLRRDPARLPDDRLAGADQTGAGGRRQRRARPQPTCRCGELAVSSPADCASSRARSGRSRCRWSRAGAALDSECGKVARRWSGRRRCRVG